MVIGTKSRVQNTARPGAPDGILFVEFSCDAEQNVGYARHERPSICNSRNVVAWNERLCNKGKPRQLGEEGGCLRRKAEVQGIRIRDRQKKLEKCVTEDADEVYWSHVRLKTASPWPGSLVYTQLRSMCGILPNEKRRTKSSNASSFTAVKYVFLPKPDTWYTSLADTGHPPKSNIYAMKSLKRCILPTVGSKKG